MSFGAAFARGLLDTARQTGGMIQQQRAMDDERRRAEALMRLQREQFEAIQAQRAQEAARQQALDQREFAEGGYTAVDPLKNASGRAMDAVPLPDMQRLAGITERVTPQTRGFDVAFRYGGQEFAKTGQSLREQEQQAARTERLTTASQDRAQRERERAEDAQRREAELAGQQAFTRERDEAAAKLQIQLQGMRQAMQSVGERQPQLITGNDGNMYRLQGGQLVPVPVAGQPAPMQDAAPARQIPIGPRRDAVPQRAPGDTMLQGLGLSPAPRTTNPSPVAPSGGAARGGGLFGRPTAAAAPKISTEAQKRLEFANVAIDAVNRYATTLDQVGPSIVAGNDPGANRLKSEYTNLLLTLKEAQNLGVLNGKDLEVLEGLLTPPVSVRGALWRGQDGLRAQVDAVRDQLTTRRSLIKQQYGVPMSLEDEFPTQTARIIEARNDGYSDDEIRAFLSGGRR